MRVKKIILSTLASLILASLPTAAHALTVTITSGGETPVVISSTDTTLVGGVATTNVDLNGVTINGFTITCLLCDISPIAAVRALQDVSVETIGFFNILITAPDPCSDPCSLIITATSDSTDFPTLKPPGGYPSGVFWDGSQDSGNNILLTGFAQGDAINATPGAGPEDTPASLPASCTGDPTCSTFESSFYDQLGETIQVQCDSPPCQPSVAVTYTGNFVAGGRVAFSFGTGGAAQSRTGSADSLVALRPPFSAFTTDLEIHLEPGAGANDKFEIKSLFTLGAPSNGINPRVENVRLRIGTFSITIPGGSFTRDGTGNWSFNGVINGVDLNAHIVPQAGNTFKFNVIGRNADLSGTANPVLVVISVGNDTGSIQVIATFV